jgi:SAM-dependent methyltransferase
VRVREAFEAPTALESRCILRLLRQLPGGLLGKDLLDLGCGLGESAAYFALEGARVTAADLSGGMLAIARRVASLHGQPLRAAALSAERLPFADASFDVVHVANTIHHLQDRERFFAEAARVLRPGGLFASWDPLAYNPLINLYRRMASAVRTEDERPLRWRDLELARRWFPDLRHRCFWIAGLALFLKYYLWDRVHPNAERYWKRILKESKASLWWWRPLAALDAGLTRLPWVERLAWNVVLWGRKPPRRS